MTVVMSDNLKNELRQKSHAMLEDMLTEEDEGVAAEDRLTSTDVFNIVLDHLGGDAIKEYRDLVSAHGAQAVEDEGIKHVYEA